MPIFDFLKKKKVFKCLTCGKYHNEFSISFKFPDCEIDRNHKGTTFSDDLYVVKGEHFFVRAVLPIPIIGYHEPFLWGVWISQSKENFLYYAKHFEEDLSGRHTFGWFSNILPGYENTFGLETQICFQKEWGRPKVEIGQSENQLYKDFVNGITLERAEELMKIFNK